ncbi:MAG: formate/nitrite transporter family protein [Chloroflexi bacterium]|nr:formate/nitrite transporter family protein [Chloroflexota bacterium]
MTDQREYFSLDALFPDAVARRVELVGTQKAALPTMHTLALGVLAGAFIALGAIFSTTVASASGDLPYGLAHLLSGIVFSLGFILVVLGGAELFTGNNLVVMAWASQRISSRALIRHWVLVYLGNAVGAISTAFLLYASGQYRFGGGVVGEQALSIATDKLEFDFLQAFFLGILGNGLVCLAIWLTFGARSSTDKIMAIIFPITAFVAIGFENCIANLYFLPVAHMIQAWDSPFIASLPTQFEAITLGGILNNIIPVTIGNLVGGIVLVSAFYWLIYLWEPNRK